MSLTSFLENALNEGYEQIGQIAITQQDSGFLLCHIDDLAHLPLGELEAHTDPEDARTIGLYGPDGEYRFTKGQLDLRTGWQLTVPDVASLRHALDAFYPASLGIWKAHEDGTVRIQNLRDKLSRQTGMYRYAGTVSDEGAQHLVKTLCGPGNNCVKKILWNISDETSLEESEASKFDGVIGPKKSIPLMCQEACNFFVAECRKQSKKEFEAAAE